MHWDFSSMISIFSSDERKQSLLDGLWGIEREAQRVTSDGSLALTPHPPAFGSKLDNPIITTDFSECQLELVTPAYATIEQAQASLRSIQSQVDKEITKNKEYLWPLSMPPKLPDEQAIPIATFGDSPEGKEREIYRQGLATRYGKKMQMISGIHYNYSLGEQLLEALYQEYGKHLSRIDFMNQLHFAIARNFLRYRWLLIYLFGASPNVDETYHSVICKELELIRKDYPDCYQAVQDFEKYATSLRVSRYGYSNVIEQMYRISFNSLEEYVSDIRKLINTKSEKFSKLGLYNDGKQVQLNDNVLQKENEFYSSIRLKPKMESGESQLEALEKRGVHYLEVRILDINPDESVGIGIEQLYFMQVFMLFCLFEENRDIVDDELERINENHHLVAMSGRRTDLQLQDLQESSRTINSWGKEIFHKLKIIAKMLDDINGDDKYMRIVEQEYMKIEDTSLLPSALIATEMKNHKHCFLEFGVARMRRFYDGFK
ncbi:glutamate--cysteine ligase [Desulfuribacillus alkaliarsenatis]|uniref:Glutamate--cysteine ligase n=1 Tax=Desulfuribacillus alkaliarsenatis TaxID=766136 RepID=A0A1E5G332_9FIRM|nr:glutamate--cysteine ligase [Desulfuribacillus alkaliarsenatis]OEF97463.1 glutamate--cysteine ligase [Desulfuribacillus alkaliarsenatis]